MEFDEKDLRREISYAIKNIHGVRQVGARGRAGDVGWGRSELPELLEGIEGATRPPRVSVQLQACPREAAAEAEPKNSPSHLRLSC